MLFRSSENLFGVSLANSDDAYLTGSLTNFNGAYSPANYTHVDWLGRDYTKPSNNAPQSFYVLKSTYAQNTGLRPTILCVKGKLTKHDGTPLSSED